MQAKPHSTQEASRPALTGEQRSKQLTTELSRRASPERKKYKANDVLTLGTCRQPCDATALPLATVVDTKLWLG